MLRELHRAAASAGRRGIVVPSRDLDTIAAKTGGNREVAQEALARLVASGRVQRARRDLVVLPDAMGLVNVDIADLIDVIAPQPYLITGGAALERAELTDQHYFGLAVLVPTRLNTLKYREQTAKFFPADPDSIWGAVGDERPRFATPERAIVDVVNHPRYGVSLTQALHALHLAVSQDQGFLDRLAATVERYGAGRRAHNGRSAARRVGLLVDLMFGADAAEPYRRLLGKHEAPVPLRPGNRADGPVDRKWRVLRNVSIDLDELVP